MWIEFLSPEEGEALLLSLQVSLMTVIIGLPFGVGAGWVLARKEFYAKGALETFIHLPLVLPPVVTGYLLLLVFGSQRLLGQLAEGLGLGLSFSWRGAVLASLVVSFPLYVNAIRLAMEAVDQKLEEAGQTLGMGSWRVFWQITPPLSWPGLVTGAMLAFARSLGEFGATITFVSNIPGETQTLPLALYSLTQIPGAEFSALKLCALSLALALLALWGARQIRKGEWL